MYLLLNEKHLYECNKHYVANINTMHIGSGTTILANSFEDYREVLMRTYLKEAPLESFSCVRGHKVWSAIQHLH